MPRWIRDRLLAGEQLVGCFLQVPSAAVCEVMAGSAAFQYLCVEGEHSGLSDSEVAALVRAVDLLATPCLVRVAANDQTAIALALDAGAAGVIVPRVSSAAEAADASRAARYPPEGTRGIGPTRVSGFGSRLAAYVDEAREHTLVSVQVETRAAVAAVDEIAATEGVDLVFVGPGDLGMSLGLDGSELDAVITGVFDRAAAAGKLTGMYAPSAEGARGWLERGVNLVLFASDLGLLRAGIQQAAAVLDRAGS